MAEQTGSTQSLSEFLARQIRRAKELRHQRKSDPKRAAQRQTLRQWQSARLAGTYQNFLASTQYRAAAEFFLDELYGLKDTSKRDADFERLYPTMIKLLPEAALHSLGLAFELDALSEELDLTLLDVLVNELGVNGEQITEQSYAEAYRRCDNYQQRQRQIELLRLVGEDLDTVVHKPLVVTILQTMRKPAQLAGFGEVQAFLERGVLAFRQLDDATPFLTTIERRERQILDNIYNNAPNPFKVEEQR